MPILEGEPYRVYEHQAELRLKKLTEAAESYPDTGHIRIELNRLQAHLKKVTVWKRLRVDSIPNLGDVEYKAAVEFMGADFQWPVATQASMLARAAIALRA
eukprot:294530-Pyramimonas_sp.AAC.1